LQEFEFEPLGGTETISVDSRVILATNENLEKAVAEGRFRQDLYYRIHVIHIELPALRERRDDIPLLSQHFLQTACKEFGRTVDGFTDDAMQVMVEHLWPGNIRELENAIQRAVLLTKSKSIDVASLPFSLTKHPTSQIPNTPVSAGNLLVNNIDNYSQSRSGTRPLSEALEGPEREIILAALRQNDWNRNVTADLLGINRTTLYKKMKKLGIEQASH
jgi:DNA-binding NtrC family response regulator